MADGEQGTASGAETAGDLDALLRQVSLTWDYRQFSKLCRKRRKFASAPSEKPIRLALLGGATTDFLEAPFSLELESLGLNSVIHCADYNSFTHEMLAPDSETVSFAPDLTVLLPTPFNITEWPQTGASDEQVERLVAEVCEHFLGLCEALHSRTKSDIILGNFHCLPVRGAGNLGCRLPWDRNTFIRQVNMRLARKAPAYIHIFDIESLSAHHGVANWFDTRFWHHAKQPVSFDSVVPLVRGLGATVAAIFGKTAKCLVLDLDNTLWGGVIGDDGLDGIKVGEGDALGEAFKAFQDYLGQLKARGMLLAVCSKNEPENARAPFEKHPDMVLKLDDIASFKASWNPKPEALEEIARELNIGLDSLVFIDDNPAERELMRQTLPQVRVVELTTDPSEYPMLLDRTGWCEMARFTSEDGVKTEQYRQKAEREGLESAHVDYDSFLKSLNQSAVVKAFDAQNNDRITQLINKTNQFNLTTRRMTRSEVDGLTARDDVLTTYVRLSDRFGDSGLISVMMASRSEDVMQIDLWAMSCRVFKRGVEHLMANHLFEAARRQGVRSVRGVYLPTEKNKSVADLYAELGFDCEHRAADGSSVWSRDVATFKPFPVHISVEESDQ